MNWKKWIKFDKQKCEYPSKPGSPSFCLALGLDNWGHDLAGWAHPRGYTIYTDVYLDALYFVTRINRLMRAAQTNPF